MLANLRALFVVVIDIIRFKGGPENLPMSTALLACVVAAFAAATAIAAAQVATPAQTAWPAELLCGIVVTLAWYQVSLRNAKKRERFVQTMTALFAVRALFMPAVLPMAAVMRTDLAATQTTPLPLALATVVLTLWLLAIEVRIIRTAFEWPTGGALGMVLAQEFSAALFFGILLGLTTNPG
jgi:hypothetical protein